MKVYKMQQRSIECELLGYLGIHVSDNFALHIYVYGYTWDENRRVISRVTYHVAI